MADWMELRILLPHQLFFQHPRIRRLVVETTHGSLGLLPRRLDCILALQPGILTYQAEEEPDCYLALDAGILLKRGAQVTLAVRRAIGGATLPELQHTVEKDFLTVDAHELQVRTALQRLESGFARRFMELKRHD